MLSDRVQPITAEGILLGLFLMGITLFLMRKIKLPLTRELIVATLRTISQLVLVGFLLEYIFSASRWYWVVGLLLAMLWIATHTANRRLRTDRRKDMFGSIFVSLLIGSGFTILWVNRVVIAIEPWYHPQYIIPLAGMIVGNSLNSASLALERFYGEIEQRKAEIETLLALGASTRDAADAPLQSAVLAAMIPNINSMMVVGVVSLPGMMTGQILAGQPPLSAVTYQIIVMFMITCAAAITTVLVTQLALAKSFNAAEQLVA